MAEENTGENFRFDDVQIQRAEELKNIFGEIRDAVRDANKELSKSGEQTASYSSAFTGIATSASKVAQLQGEIADSASGTNKASKERAKLEAKIKQIQAQQKIFAASNTKLGEKQAENLQYAVLEAEELLGIYDELVDQGKELDKKTKFFTGLQNFVKSVPGLKALSGPFDKAAKAAREAAAEGGSSRDAFKAGGKSLLDSFKQVSIIGLIIQGIVMAIKAGFQVDQEVTDLRKGLNLSYNEASNLRSELAAIPADMDEAYVTTTARVEKLISLNKQFGTSVSNINQDIVAQAITLEKQVGLSAEAAGSLSKMFILTEDSADKTASSLLGVSQVLQGQNNVSLDNKAVLEEISGVSGAIRANFIGNNRELAKTVTTAQMLGLNLKSIEGIQSSLLDFEGSISKELEAELLTGKQLNLERARAAALNNDYATVAREITSQVGSLADFQNMGYLAQAAIAESVGMTRDSLADTLVQQELLTKLGADEKTSAEERLRLAIEKYGTEEAAAKALGEQALENLKALSAQEEFNLLIEQLKQALKDIVGGPIGEMLKNLTSSKEQQEKLINGVKKFGKFVLTVVDNFDKLKYVLVGILAVKTAIAAASIASAIAGTAGVGASWIIPAVAGGVAAVGGMLALADGAIDGHDGPVIKRNKDQIRIRKDDQMIIGTNLFGDSNGSSSELDYNKLASAMASRPVVLNVDGKRFGELSNNTTGQYTYSLER